jgi:D-sedoheptulose 7-phosphate isomerase
LVADAAALVRVAGEMAGRFRAGGTLFAIGPAVADAQHVTVEFIHPVLVGKRALPALHVPDPSLLHSWVAAADIVLAVAAGDLGAEPNAAMHAARDRGALVVAMTAAGASTTAADHVLCAPSDDPLVARELQVTTYHLLWELVHLHLERNDFVGDADCLTEPECITCSDRATPARVVRLLDGALALVDTGESVTEISVALVQARVGDTVLVHAGEAIGLAVDPAMSERSELIRNTARPWLIGEPSDSEVSR